MKEKFNFETAVPFDYDLDMGINLLDKKKITLSPPKEVDK